MTRRASRGGGALALIVAQAACAPAPDLEPPAAVPTLGVVTADLELDGSSLITARGRLDLVTDQPTHLEVVDGRVEQSYVLHGDRLLTRLPGSRSHALRDGAVLLTSPAGALRVDGLVAWDAWGAPVPGRLEPAGDGFLARFDVRGATQPITVDPWLTATPTWGSGPLAGMGAEGLDVALGDFDGDGTQDAAIGIPGWDGALYGGGAVAIYADVLNAGTSPTLVLEGMRERAWFGSSLAVADVDDDGFDDLFVGSPGADAVALDVGLVERFAGTAAGLDPAAADAWFGAWEGGALGTVLDAVGDLDADQLPDVAAGAPFADPTGAVPGAALVLLAGGPVELLGTRPNGRFGAAFAGGDVDGDGDRDLVVGAPGVGAPGAVHFYEGAALGGVPEHTFVESSVSRFGAALALGDLQPSTPRDDLVVGAPLAVGGKGALQFLGPPPNPILLGAVLGSQSNANFGSAARVVGDLDGDGLNDLVASEPGAGSPTTPAAGALRILSGGGFPSVSQFSTPGPAAFAQFGAALAAADVGADGKVDVLVGGWTTTVGGLGSSGTAWLLRGLGQDEDRDGDGYCEGSTTCGGGLPNGDCDDLNPFVHPGAPEICDELDNDCDGILLPDEDDPDGDGYSICTGDCVEGDPNAYPGAPEVCDPLDRDCDGAIDNDVIPRPRYDDLDLDGFGAGDPVEFGCAVPVPGRSEVDTDCDDADSTVFPGAAEVLCNGIDDDCTVLSPDAPDGDGDGYVPCDDCSEVVGDVLCGDCDDAERNIHPDAPEACADGIDQDCEGGDVSCDVPAPCPEPDNLCEEPGCACSTATPSRGGLLLLLLLPLLRRRRSARGFALVLLLGVAGTAAAQDTQPAQGWDARGRLDTQLLRPSFAPWSWLGSPGAHPGMKGTVRAGVFTQYEHAPLVLYNDNDAVDRILRHRVTHTLGGWWTPLDGFGFGLAMPLVGQVATWDETDWSAAPFAPGDLQLDVLWRFVGTKGLDVALGGRGFFPTSTVGSLAGEATPRGDVSLAVQGSIGPVTGLLEVRGVFRRPVPTGYDLYLGNQLALLGGVRVWPVPGKVSFQVELESRAGFAKFLKGGAENPLDLRGSLRFFPARWLTVDVGGGVGLNGGYGTPVARGLVGMTFRRLPQRPTPEEWAETGAARRAREEAAVEEPPVVVEDLPVQRKPKEEPEPEPVVEEVQEEEPLAELVADSIVINAPIEFEQDSDALLESSFPVLQEVRTVLKEHPEIAHVLIEGHASLEGRTAYNWDLSNRRAASVFRWLVESGVSSVRLSYRGMGEAVPRSNRRTARVREEDRRVEFHVVERLDPIFQDLPDWEAEAPPIPWLMEDVVPLEEGAPEEPVEEEPPAPEAPPEPVEEEEAPPRPRFQVEDDFDTDGDDDDSAEVRYFEDDEDTPPLFEDEGPGALEDDDE